LRSGSPSRSAATRSPWRAAPHSSWWSRSRSLLVRGFQVALPEVDMHRRGLVGVRPEVAGGEADRVDVLGILALVLQVRVREDEGLVDDANGADLALRIPWDAHVTRVGERAAANPVAGPEPRLP